MSQVLITEQHLIDIADSIRSKLGVQTTYKPREFSAAIDSIQTGSGADWDGFLAGTYPVGELSLQTATTVRQRVFQDCTGITSINAPNVTTINDYSFSGCTSVQTVNMPSLTTVNGPYVFRQFGSIKRASFPSLQTTGTYCFYFWGSAGASCEYLVLPEITTLGSDAFRQSYIDVIDIGPNLVTLPTRAFYGNLNNYYNTIILRANQVVTMTNANAIYKITSDCKVYVPSDLITSYKAATNWSAKGDIFYAIEDSIYDGYYADGTPI